MKKLVFMFVAMVAMSMVSCGNKTEQAAGNDTVDTAAVDTDRKSVVYTVAADSVDSIA